MDNKPSLDELTVLEHHGVKGMRWGVRRATKITDAKIDVHKRLRDHTGADSATTALLNAITAPDRATWGRGGRFEAFHDKKITELERSKERIANGEMVTRTLIFGAQYTKKK